MTTILYSAAETDQAIAKAVAPLATAIAALQSEVAAVVSSPAPPPSSAPAPTPSPSSTPSPTPTPPPTTSSPSADGTAITPSPTGQSLVDGAGNSWGFDATANATFGNEITLNGKGLTGTFATLLLWFGGKVYQSNAKGGWWAWVNGGWSGVAGDPRPAATPAAPAIVSSSSAPPPAAAAGLKTLVFESGGPTPWKLSGPASGTGVQWWGDSGGAGGHAPFGGKFAVDANNILTITDTVGQSSMYSTPYDGHEPGFFATAPCYIEARLKGPATSFIGFGYQHYLTNAGGHWPELDIVETGEVPAPGIISGNITVHDWVNGAEPVPFNNAPWGPPGTTWQSPTSQWADFSQWHVVGSLILPGKPVSGFLDNGASPSWVDPVFYPAYDTAQFVLWIGAWHGTASQFDYVRVWGP